MPIGRVCVNRAWWTGMKVNDEVSGAIWHCQIAPLTSSPKSPIKVASYAVFQFCTAYPPLAICQRPSRLIQTLVTGLGSP